MNLRQHTIKAPVTVSGVGLHTGANVNVIFNPAPPNHGIKFQRVDLEEKTIVPADVDYVVDISRGTTLEVDGARVGTIEHSLAALVGLQIDNVLIEIDGPEVPILDGSSLPFIEAIEKVGVEEQNAVREYLEITESINYRDNERDVEIAALPLNDYRITVMVDYNSPVLGSQHASLNDISKFSEDIASCRTFCFLHELEMLYKQDLIKGGDLNNAIVIVDKAVEEEEIQYLAKLFNKPRVEIQDEGTLNNVELRYKNEPARHKLLDVVGDLALVGKPIKAQILAARPGHASNVEFARKLKKLITSKKKKQAPKYDPNAKPLFDNKKVYESLPHGYPFKLVDKIIYMDDNSVVGIKNVTINEQFFQGHFEGNPVMPGVLQIEAIAQTGGIFVLNTVEDPENYWTYFLGIKECKFRKMVVPGDTLIIKCELAAPIKRGIAQMVGSAYVGDTLVCQAEVLASIVRKS